MEEVTEQCQDSVGLVFDVLLRVADLLCLLLKFLRRNSLFIRLLLLLQLHSLAVFMNEVRMIMRSMTVVMSPS